MSFPRAPRRPAPPGEREALLDAAEGPARPIYETVRAILDDLETAAPWAHLYYPPEEQDRFLGLARDLAAAIQSIPARIQKLTDSLAADDSHPPTDETLGDIQFFFEGIHMMARQELEKLVSWLTQMTGAEHDGLGNDERTYLCEVASDLKGKYTSSIMGAAASLIAAERWNGVEIEPILFPEKAEEFERNRQLLSTLTEVSESIRRLPREVSLPRLVSTWRGGKKVDQYALTPFYGFLATLGQLLKEGTRRALYSGDYHQVRKREAALAGRINELTMLHNASWGMPVPGPAKEPAALFPEMARKATEIASLLDVDVLKEIVGEKTVKDVHAVVQIEGERQKAARGGGRRPPAGPSTLRAKIPEELLTLVDLLYDEDLKTFLDLLLGSVRKRASLALDDQQASAGAAGVEAEVEPEVAPEAPAAVVAEKAAKPGRAEKAKAKPAEAPPAEAAAAGGAEALPSIEALLSGDEPAFYLDAELGWEPKLEAEPAGPAPAAVAREEEEPEPARGPERRGPERRGPDRVVPVQDRLAVLDTLQQTLGPLLSAAHPERKAFDFLHRFLKQKRSVPPGMVKSIRAFLELLLDDVVPKIEAAVANGDLPETAMHNLEHSCRTLLDGRIGPDELKSEVPVHMDRILHLLDGLNATATAMQEELAPGSGYWRVARSDDLSREW